MTTASSSVQSALETTTKADGQLRKRNARARRWSAIYLSACILALLGLILLFGTVLNNIFGVVVKTYAVRPSQLSPNQALETLSEAELGTILSEYFNKQNRGIQRVRVLVRDNLLGKNIDPARLSGEPVSSLFAGKAYPAEIADLKFSDLTVPQLIQLLESNINQSQLYHMVVRDVLQPRIPRSWTLLEGIFSWNQIETEVQAKYPGETLTWHSWFSWAFVSAELTSDPSTTGLRMAIVGTVYILILTVLISIPLGIGAAIYLEEYAKHSRFTTLLETIIRNLAGVPSIIYGMLGLSLFVRALGDEAGITNGRVFGITDTNGRTILSASLTMSLLILPVIIINSQEAIRAVPASLREASYGIGATKWQTVWRTVLPAGLPGILTGVILSLARAVGETAPLLVVGGLTFLTVDPNSIFSKFSVIPIQIFSWTSEPNPQFKNVAAAAIITLLGILLTLNAAAIILRQRYSKKLRGA